MLGEIEAKLTINLISNYNKLKIGTAIILAQNIVEFDSESKQAKYDLVNYSSIKIKEILMLIYPIRYMFEFDRIQSVEINKLTEILLDIFTMPEADEEAALKDNLRKLEDFFSTSPLYDYLERQLYIVDNSKYFHQTNQEDPLT